jgi:hypothetical protein
MGGRSGADTEWSALASRYPAEGDMGSFSELVLSFPLRADVGRDVLASFASIAVPHPDAPELPPPNPSNWEWEPDGPECDLSDPWSQDWGEWLNASYTDVYIGSDQVGTMIWRRDHWVITSRATWKSIPEAFVANLSVLGSIISVPGYPIYDSHWHADDYTTGFFVGYTKQESEPRPWLLWVSNGVLRAENLNPPGFRV